MLLRHVSHSALRSSNTLANCNYRTEITGIECRTFRPLRAWIMFRNSPWIFVAVAARNATQGFALGLPTISPTPRQSEPHALSERALAGRAIAHSIQFQLEFDYSRTRLFSQAWPLRGVQNACGKDGPQDNPGIDLFSRGCGFYARRFKV
jgi:hypothetical protein